MSDIFVNIHISGVVQGVGFRYFVYRNATARGLRGYVQNLPDGTVMVVAAGPKGLLEDLIGDLRVGPRSSHVTGITLDWGPGEDQFETFEIR